MAVTGITTEVRGAGQSGGDKVEFPHGDFWVCGSMCDNVQETVEWIILSQKEGGDERWTVEKHGAGAVLVNQLSGEKSKSPDLW